MNNLKKMTIDGNTAAAMASQFFTEVAAIYPITPSSPMAEEIDKWSAAGKKNIFGSTVIVMEMQSEGGAAGTLHGVLQGGALGTTYTSSQGLLLMIPNLYKIAGELLPGVLHVSARSLASNALSIFGDHQDVMSIRQTGMALLASGSVQECMDLGCIAHLAAIHSRVPFVHFFDGFRTSHEIQKIEVLEEEHIRSMVDWESVAAFRERALNPDHPVLRGTTDNPDIFFQLRESVNKFYVNLPETVQMYMDKVNAITGRDYKLFNYYGDPQATDVIVSMGSSCEVIRETIECLNAGGVKLGLVQVRLYRPFDAKALCYAIPDSTKRLTVLDRTKEPGAQGEPLYLDVCNALRCQKRDDIEVVGGRYGIASKDFRPADVLAVCNNMKEGMRNGFTVGIKDDVTHLSLEMPKKVPDTSPKGTVSCKFWGLGSDGTVSANKSAVKIIGNHTDLYAQGYFSYDSKKSGGLTVSHLRFGEEIIRSSYLCSNVDYVACHNQTYVRQYQVLDGIKEKGIFLLNCVWSDEELAEKLTQEMKELILNKKIEFYTINAFDVAEKIGLGRRINMIMQTAFFALAKLIPEEDYVHYLKAEVQKNYGNRGEKVVNMNNAAIDQAKEALHKVDLNKIIAKESVADIVDEALQKEKSDFVLNVMEPINRQLGDNLPVSAFNGAEDGTFPTYTTRFEKRGISLSVPKWSAEQCLQCNLCSVSCPHSVLRPLLLTKEQRENAPKQIKEGVVEAKGYQDRSFYMGLSPLDCTGCGNCIDVCPAKEKALQMIPLEESTEAENWDYVSKIVPENLPKNIGATIKGSQFLKPYFEFSGACAGCGETPYAKLVTQLFGNRMMISNSAGCTTVWGGSAPSVPFTRDEKGHGPSWGFSLFEDNAEYGLGMFLGYSVVRHELKEKLDIIRQNIEGSNDIELLQLAKAIDEWNAEFDNGENTREQSEKLCKLLKENEVLNGVKEVLERGDYLIKRSNWIFGGDGWAYDIGYGGLDHVMSTGNDINVMVFDTEVYSNTGGQASKSTPRAAIAKFAAAGKKNRKKDLGRMIMSYGNVYVAQIALGANPAQALKAIREAEAYNGPSLIIGYAPCVNHGIKAGMGKTQSHERKAVESGYWNLYRYNPMLTEEGKNPFQLDCGEPKLPFRDFLMSEVRYMSLMQKDSVLAEELFAAAEQDAHARYEQYRKMSL
ncbi:MAG: pyruvate:ferredoxin (flavodoxin) oxidoreductase [Lachnospiraceae bacterium]|nr:pyruvate:ferredoxin (flavodoxin) oxidoreductase [Lachnospiraceae bacterium]